MDSSEFGAEGVLLFCRFQNGHPLNFLVFEETDQCFLSACPMVDWIYVEGEVMEISLDDLVVRNRGMRSNDGAADEVGEHHFAIGKMKHIVGAAFNL